MESKELKAMRYMAWERTKGELNSMLVTYWGQVEKYDRLSQAINDFINDIEHSDKHL